MEITTVNLTENQFVVFKLGEEYYGIDIYKVKIINKVANFTRVPNAPSYVKGVINLRGEVVTIIDLRKRFGLPPKESDEDSRIIILNIDDYEIGLIVDSSSEVLQLDTDTIDNPPVVGENIAQEFVKGIGKKDGRLIMLLDLYEVLGIKDKIAENLEV